jgi:hypothetical protein
VNQEIEIRIRTSDLKQGFFSVYPHPEEQKDSPNKLRLSEITWDKEPHGVIENVTLSLVQDGSKTESCTVDNNDWWRLKDYSFDKLCKEVFAGAELKETVLMASRNDDVEDLALAAPKG